MKVLLTGANGQLGRCFQDIVPADWQIMAAGREKLNIADYHQVEQLMMSFQPDLVVNAAAYTAVDKAESENEIAYLVNAKGPENLAKVSKRLDAVFFHISTDYVFDGSATTPYTESDETHPLSVYGASKLEGERAVLGVYADAIILRTSWVFSEYGNNFVKTILRLAREKDILNIVADQRGCPTYAGDIAKAIIQLYEQKASGGIYHFCGDHKLTWKEFAEKIMAGAAKTQLLNRIPHIRAMSTSEYSAIANRPAYSVLACEKIKHYAIEPSDLQKALANCLQKLM